MYMNLNNKLVIGVDTKTFQFGRFVSSTVDTYGFAEFVTIDELLEKKEEFFPNDILTDFEKLLISKKSSDAAILVGDKKFDAHKVILTTRSCVFKAMYSYDMKEKKENEVTITDIDGEIFEKLLEYIYTDKVKDLDTFAEGLLEAS
ncbi:hypothetical protein KQX54_020014 [Cotesia glomerata]|uniref:BTB domain-containing protein n=1 Tax=Cotesia glomerata TaxID=32391 RepID=A0AAV7IAD0_COTGL|nr:hypothetical protein KQX54_020014 [Cotesia glomerata]